MNRKGPWEGYRRQAKLARCLLPAAFLCAYIKERRLGTRQTKYNEVIRGGEGGGGGGGGRYIYFWRTPEISSSFSNLKVSTIAIVIIIFFFILGEFPGLFRGVPHCKSFDDAW